MRCKVGQEPFKYLDASVGDSPNFLPYWNILILQINSKQHNWNEENLSMTRRLVLFKAVTDGMSVMV